MISRSHTAPSWASTFVRFSDDRWLFFLTAILIVFFVFVLIVLGVLRRQVHDSYKARVEPRGNLLLDGRDHTDLPGLSRTDVNARKPELRVVQCCEAKKAPIMTLRNRRSADSGRQCTIYELRPRFSGKSESYCPSCVYSLSPVPQDMFAIADEVIQ